MVRYKGILKALFCFFVLLISHFVVSAHMDTITVQLKWKHQYQFAGYYAAQIKGYYKNENLYVNFRESSKDIDVANAVISETADFAIAGSEVILDYVNNKPIVVLASIFQHSPYVIISRKEKKITKPTDLAGKVIVAAKGQGLLLLQALLRNEGIPLDSLKILTPLRNPSLEDTTIDAITAYKSDKPGELEAVGIETSIIDPADYGIDFYGDVIITSKEQTLSSPELVERFLSASLKGWKYALQNSSEISDYILTLPGVKKRNIDKEFLLKEAKMIHSIVRPDLVEIGHMNRGRWENILKSYEELGVIPKTKARNLDDFLYHPEEQSSRYVKRLVFICSVLLIIALFFLIRNILIKFTLKTEQQKLLQADIKGKISEDTINTILEHAGIILWNWNVVNSEFVAYGHENNVDFETKNLNSIEDFRTLIHPDTSKKFDLFLSLLPDNFSGEVLVKINNTYQWYMLTAKVRERDEHNNPVDFLGLLIDISGLKKKEENLDKLSNELKKTNSELQKFAYITSHNLRAPVVNLGSLIEFYDHSSEDKESNTEIVQKMSVSVNQLKTTLEDLIDVVSKKSEDLNFQKIDLFEEIEKIIKKLKLNPFLIVEYDFSQIPQIEYPVKYFHTIFLNLVLNSSKYKNPEKPAEIKIRSYDADEYTAIDFSDNGIGIDLEKNKEKMFGLYQRFHPEIEGKGIGLFIIKSQIESLDGKIEVKSKLKLGTTFTVFFRKRAL